jgi:hypothetical protein
MLLKLEEKKVSPPLPIQPHSFTTIPLHNLEIPTNHSLGLEEDRGHKEESPRDNADKTAQ